MLAEPMKQGDVLLVTLVFSFPFCPLLPGFTCPACYKSRTCANIHEYLIHVHRSHFGTVTPQQVIHRPLGHLSAEPYHSTQLFWVSAPPLAGSTVSRATPSPMRDLGLAVGSKHNATDVASSEPKVRVVTSSGSGQPSPKRREVMSNMAKLLLSKSMTSGFTAAASLRQSRSPRRMSCSLPCNRPSRLTRGKQRT